MATITFNDLVQNKTENKKVLSKDEKLALVRGGITKIKKEFGSESIFTLGDQANRKYPHISSGIMPLDIALGIGGFPKGRIVEIFGAESSGKTTITLHLIAETQKNGGVCAFIDTEHALDPKYAKDLGVNVDELILAQPEYAEQALTIMDELVKTGGIDVIVLDSVAALVMKAELEGEMGQAHMALNARLLSQAFRKLTAITAKSGAILVFINQLRDKIGTYGGGKTTTGGNALKFYSSVRLEVKKKDAEKSGDEVIGNRTIVKVVKNKVAPPFKEAEFLIKFGEGASRTANIFDMAVECGVITKKGAGWFNYGETRLGQGYENVYNLFKSDEKFIAEVEQKVKEHHGFSEKVEVDNSLLKLGEQQIELLMKETPTTDSMPPSVQEQEEEVI